MSARSFSIAAEPSGRGPILTTCRVKAKASDPLKDRLGDVAALAGVKQPASVNNSQKAEEGLFSMNIFIFAKRLGQLTILNTVAWPLSGIPYRMEQGVGSFDIGAKLRQERLAQELAISDIARDTRIAPHFLEAIETADFAHLPGLVFTRNFVRQYALSLKLDPDLLLAELPKQDESTVQLPVPPSRARTSYYRHRTLHSAFSSLVPLTIAAGGLFAAYIHFNRAPHMLAAAENIRSAQVSQPREARRAQLLPVSLPVKVSMTARQRGFR